MSASVSRRREAVDVRRKQIFDEAITLIGQKGYAGFTVQELARRCGLTNGGLLYHFGTKDQILIALLQERDRRDALNVRLVGPVRQDTDQIDLKTALGLLRAIVARNSAQPGLVRLYVVLQADALDPDHPAHSYFQAREAAALEAIAKMFEAHTAQPHSVARRLLALMGGLEQQWLRANQAFDLVEEWDRAVAGCAAARPREET